MLNGRQYVVIYATGGYARPGRVPAKAVPPGGMQAGGMQPAGVPTPAQHTETTSSGVYVAFALPASTGKDEAR
jgi:hypothetical protein